MQVGEVLTIMNHGAVVSMRKDSDDRAFIPGWMHRNSRDNSTHLVTTQGVELTLKDLIAFYVHPNKKSKKIYKALGCNVMVLKHDDSKGDKSDGAATSGGEAGRDQDGKKKRSRKSRDRRVSTKSAGAASSNGEEEETDGAAASKKKEGKKSEVRCRIVLFPFSPASLFPNFSLAA